MCFMNEHGICGTHKTLKHIVYQFYLHFESIHWLGVNAFVDLANGKNSKKEI